MLLQRRPGKSRICYRCQIPRTFLFKLGNRGTQQLVRLLRMALFQSDNRELHVAERDVESLPQLLPHLKRLFGVFARFDQIALSKEHVPQPERREGLSPAMG